MSGTWWERFGATDDEYFSLTDDALARHLGTAVDQARRIRRLFGDRLGIRALDAWAADCESLADQDCASWDEPARATFLGAHRVEVGRDRQTFRREFAVVVWDHSPGHVVLVFELHEEAARYWGPPFPADAATAAARVLAPVWWRHARVFVPIVGPDHEEPRYARVVMSGETVRSASRRHEWRRKRVLSESLWQVNARPAGECPASTVTALLGEPVPAWPAAARTWRFVSDWATILRTVEGTALPQVFRDLFAGLRYLAELEIPDLYPVLFGQISRVVRDELLYGLTGSARTPEKDWQWAVRLTGSAPSDILALLDRSRAQYAVPVPRAEYLPLLEAADRCAAEDVKAWSQAIGAIGIVVPDLPWPGYGVHVRTVRADGPLVTRWLGSLTPLGDDHPPSIRLDALKRRLSHSEHCYRDAQGRYVVTGWDAPNREFAVAAEWPTAGLSQVPPDAAVVAADQPGDDVLVFVVRDTRGEITVEPLPAERSAEPGYGLGTQTPAALYTSLISAAGLSPASSSTLPNDSELLTLLRTATGSLRLDWTWVRNQAEADVRKANAAHTEYLAELHEKYRQRQT